MSATANDGMASLEADRLEETAELIRLAAAGDRRAAGEYFAQNLHRLSVIARKIAGTSMDHGDLLGDALLIVLTKWADGTGPTGNVNAYIGKIMRNRLLDELKSPRSRVGNLDPDYDPPAAEDGRIRRVEMEQELALVRRALAQLPADQRDVLVATAIEGQKPRDLEERFDRPASSIYSLTKRAKDNLRRTILQMLLSEDARSDCAEAAKHLPKEVGDSPEETASGADGWFAHYPTCRRCRRAWARFGALTALGLAPLLVVSDLLFAVPVSADISEEVASESSPTHRPPHREPDGGAARLSAATRALNLVGPAIAAVGVLILAVLMTAFLTKTLWFASEPTASIGVDSTWSTPTTSELELRFEVVDETWHTRTLQVELSEPVLGVRPPAGWECSLGDLSIICITATTNARGGEFVLEHARAEDAPRYRIILTTATETGDTVIGTASGTVQP